MAAVVRLAREADAEQIRAIYGPIVGETPISFEEVPPDREEMHSRIVSTLAERPWIVCERSDEILGYAYAGRHRARAAYRWSVDTSVYVRPDARRAGIARALYRSLLALLVVQNYYNAYAGIALPNPASVGLHEAVGFRPVGVYREVGYKLGRWHDVGWWQLALQPKPAIPADPLSVSEARSSPRWQEALSAGESLLRL